MVFGGVGDVEEGGGEGLFAAEGLAGAVGDEVEFVEADDATAVAAEDEDGIWFVDTEFPGFAAALEDVEFLDGDAAGGVGRGGVNVFAEEGQSVAVGGADLVVGVVGIEGDDKAYGLVEGGEV